MSAELRATYRLQLTDRFGFSAARALIPYLRDLGISHLYLSPSFQARPGSGHGYDVIDPGRLSDGLGGRAAFEQLAGEARGAGMALILDVVPNHMAADEANRYWSDPALRQKFFDIDPATGRHRRFFDIDDLAGLRQEDPEVFEATHGLALELVRAGLVDGLRVDHPDGLADPAGYLERLRSGGAQRVWVEKILDPGEELRDWPVSGTVGYEFLNDVCALVIDPAAEPTFTALWQEVSGDTRGFGEWALEAKRQQAETTFKPEVERLARLRETPGLETALASLPIYRTYVEAAAGRVSEADRAALAELEPALRRALLLEDAAPAEFVTRFQQTTPAIMAKGVEDTAFYRYGRLLALNEVGGDPSRFGIDVADFHRANRERAARFPESLLTTMTHDAKRSADVRARIAALSWIPEEWSTQVERWFALTESEPGPDGIDRYLIFQTLVGAWPIEPARIDAYLVKAAREAKRHTTWVDQDAGYEQELTRFWRAVPFAEQFGGFVERVAGLGERAALAQLALKLTVPGVPDIYQGDELPYRALVDPDNRRPIDWGWSQAMLQRVMGGSPPVPETRKLFLILRLLGLRSRRPDLFASASYEPLDGGPGTCAFLRGDDLLVVVALTRAGVGDAEVELPGGRWRDVLRGDERSFGGRAPVTGLVTAPMQLGIYERIGA